MSTPTAITTSSAILGQTLVTLRKAKNMTQGDVAEAMGMSSSNWSRAEKGESSLSVDQLRAVARVLGTTPEAILKATEVAEQEAGSKGVKVVPGTVASSKVGAAVVAGAATGLAIPVVGPVLGGIIGAALATYFASQKSKGQ